MTTPDALARVRDADLSALDHADVPFEMIVERLNLSRSQAHSPVYQVMINLQDTQDVRFDMAGTAVELIEQHRDLTDLDLSVSTLPQLETLSAAARAAPRSPCRRASRARRGHASWWPTPRTPPPCSPPRVWLLPYWRRGSGGRRRFVHGHRATREMIPRHTGPRVQRQGVGIRRPKRASLRGRLASEGPAANLGTVARRGASGASQEAG